MTCIIGVFDKEQDCVYIGADSLASNWHHQYTLRNRKVFKAKDNKNILMAICGTVKLQNFLSVEDCFIEEIKELKNEVDFEHIVKYTAPRIISLARKYDCCINNSGDIDIQGFIIFAYKNQLYIIESNGQVIQSEDDYLTSGTGGDFAMAVLSQNKDKSTIDRIKEGLEASDKHACGVKRPFYIMNTKNDEVIKID